MHGGSREADIESLSEEGVKEQQVKYGIVYSNRASLGVRANLDTSLGGMASVREDHEVRIG